MTSEMILVVDDDPDARSMLAHALGHAGFLVQLASDGEAAISSALRSPPDLVLMDAVMPGMSGFDACRRLKSLVGFGDRPVVFMTGLSETEHVVEGFRAGGVDYVTKPLVLDELTARIRVHLANARLAMSARSALDMAGRALLAADSQGRVLWRTPQAAALLGEGEPRGLTELLRSLASHAPDPAAAPHAFPLGERRLQIAYIGREGPEAFFRLAEPVEGREELILREALKLTGREADVLLWISRGKSNKDISDILNISARTVNKHLEQIFPKLGVENRASAAAVATRVIAAV
ncbi:MAG: two-component response regulator [Caulobacteraceae bacterium]|nr:two-component response regulator [Caulobacteraceae bacterium]